MDSQDIHASATNHNNVLPDLQHRLFDERRLRVPASELEDITLDLYLGACILQATHLHTLRSPAQQDWQSTAWDFGRFAKAHPRLISLDSGLALAMVRRVLGTHFWQRLLDMSTVDAEMAFDHVWNECWCIPGYDPLTVAVLKAGERPDPADPQQPYGYDTFLATIRFLQEDAGNAPILLPCHKLANLLHCLPMTVSRYRSKALREGYLQVLKEHRFRPNSQGEATEFRYIPTAQTHAK
jgi:hypothetical protein